MNRKTEECPTALGFYELADCLLPTLPWFPRTEDMADRIAWRSDNYLGYEAFTNQESSNENR